MKVAGRAGLFPLSKLGPGFAKNRFMDSEGSNLQLKFGRWQELMFEPHTFAKAQKHADWKRETSILSKENKEDHDEDELGTEAA